MLALDVDHFYELLQTEYADNPNVRKQKKVQKLYAIRNLYVRTIIRMFRNPDAIRYLLTHFIQKRRGAYQPQTIEGGFFDTDEFTSLLQGE